MPKHATLGRIGVHGFVNDKGAYITIDAPGASVTEAIGVNNRGEVLGQYSDNGLTVHGFLEHDGTYTTIGAPDAVVGVNGYGTLVTDINARGQVSGTYFDTGFSAHGFVYDDGSYATINPPGGSGTFGTSATGINDQGDVVGNYGDTIGGHGYIDERGTYTTIDPPGFGGVIGVSNQGEVIGIYFTNADGVSISHGFIAGATGTPAGTTVVTLRDLLASQTSQISMNDLVRGDAVGSISAQGSVPSSLRQAPRPEYYTRKSRYNHTGNADRRPMSRT
jgi:hypothetical protein